MMRLKKLSSSLLALGLLMSVDAQAHRAWMSPSATVLSGDSSWVTVDGAISNSLFYFEHHPLDLSKLKIISPTGDTVLPQNKSKGIYRSTFDVELLESGTYTLQMKGSGVSARYDLDGKSSFWRGTADTIDSIPKDAKNVKLTEFDRNMQVFITKGAPSKETFKPSGQGLEMIPVTHPNDLFTGETATFRFLLDGKPASDTKVTVIRDGIRYRDQVEEQEFTSDAKGLVKISWSKAGKYWLEAKTTIDSQQFPGAQRRLSYSSTLEVLPL